MAETQLVVPVEDARSRLDDRLSSGRDLLDRSIPNEPGLEQGRSDYETWTSYNRQLLKTLFSTSELADEYDQAYGYAHRLNATLSERVERLRSDIKHDISTLRSIRERLDLFTSSHSPEKAQSPPQGNDVFVVHGHNSEIKETVARFLEQQGLSVTILHEQASGGRTVIEKFMDHANVSFAVVLLTADDVGAAKNDKEDLRYRARQNVILELGYFVGSLGRANTCALVESGVEIPSDFAGVVYVPLDEAGAWKMTLGREMRTAGLKVDLNRIVDR